MSNENKTKQSVGIGIHEICSSKRVETETHTKENILTYAI